MRHPIDCHHQSSRRGISLVEVILIIFALLLLLALLLPWIQQTHEPHRRVWCLNNLKNLGLAATNFATGRHGQLPLLSEPAPGLASESNTIWIMQLLPYMDRADTHEYINLAKSPQDANLAVQAVLSQSYSFLQCPQDSNRFKQPGGLSYAANIGYGAWRGSPQGITTAYDFALSDHSAASIDWNNNGKRDAIDKEVARATGVFWFADEDEFRITLDDINEGDGTGSTILFAETTNLPPMHQAGSAENGLNPGALEAGIGLGYEALGLKKNKKPSLFLNRASKASSDYSKFFGPNSNRGKATGHWPAASSMHQGIVNVVFADGHAGSISNDINWAVWASLHSPRGIRHGQAKISDSDY